MKPTEEQAAIIEATSRGESCLVVALAGAAKTTTLVWAGQEITHQNALAIAFNVKIKNELETRLPFPAKTLNGLGYAAFGRAKLDPNKMTELRKKNRFEYDAQLMASSAKLQGLVPKTVPGKGMTPDDDHVWKQIYYSVATGEKVDIDQMINQARILLHQSIVQAGNKIIDFDDQVYMPTIFGGSWRKYNLLMVDEAQDLSPLNHRMVEKTKGSQIMAVGDPLQSIYAWRGADTDSMENLKRQYDLKTYTLSTSFRCPKAVVEIAQQWAPNMRYPEWAKDGEIIDLRNKGWNLSAFPGKITFVCRNNAPLIRVALQCALAGKAITFIGAQRLEQIMNSILRAMKAKETDDMDVLQGKLQDWLGQFADASDFLKETMLDRAKALAMVLSQSSDLLDARRNIKSIFANKHADIIFSTGHGAKGLEWDNVAFLDKHLLPSSFAHTKEALQQEANLEYVITTRTKERLYYVNSSDSTI